MTAVPELQRSDHDSGRKANFLVWLLAGVALTAGALTLCLLWRALHTIELERTALFSAQTQSLRDISRIEAEIIRGRNDLKTILDPEIVPSSDHNWLRELENLMTSDTAVESEGDGARDIIAALRTTLEDCRQWRRRSGSRPWSGLRWTCTAR
jgi:hypothetical protein